MAHLGTLSHYHFQEDIDDIRGAKLYGRNDDKLGKIDDVIFEHDSGNIRYAVVDTGGWLSSKKFMVPAERISVRDDGELFVDLTREQIERFPKYDENLHTDSDRWNDYEHRYHESWSEVGGVLHKEGSPNIITPDPDEMPAVSEDVKGDFTPDRMAGRFPDTAPGSSKIRMRPSGTPARAEDTSLPGHAQNTELAHWQEPDDALSDQALEEDTSSYRATFNDIDEDLHRPYPVQEGRQDRWQAFEENLRRNRVDITASCHSCAPQKDKAA